MSAYTVEFLDDAIEDLRHIDKTITHRKMVRIKSLAENFDLIKPISLKGKLAGLLKLRVGDYRVIYQIIRKEKVIMIHAVGHRKDIYL
ncbi:MAG: type II toxin-antitoxin system RelE/ParE family toxin [Bacteroidota bacterium]|nr:type II toxin-antitoxin system RelE/ParE family toxin [Bacteroidota bacterium]